MMYIFSQINKTKEKTKISHSNRTASPLKMLRAHVMATTQQQYQPPTMSSLGQINQRRIKTKISQTDSTASKLKILRAHVRSEERREWKDSRSRRTKYNNKKNIKI